jgi:putative transposase
VLTFELGATGLPSAWERISETTRYNSRSRYGGMEVSDAKRLRALEEENRKLKKLLAEAMLDNATLKDTASGKF